MDDFVNGDVLNGDSVLGFVTQQFGNLSDIAGSQAGSGPLITAGLNAGILNPFSQSAANFNFGQTGYILNNSGSNIDPGLFEAAYPGLWNSPAIQQGYLGGTGGSAPTVLDTSQPMYMGGFEPGIGMQYYTNWGNVLTSSGLGGILDQNVGSYDPNLNFNANFMQNAGLDPLQQQQLGSSIFYSTGSGGLGGLELAGLNFENLAPGGW